MGATRVEIFLCVHGIEYLLYILLFLIFYKYLFYKYFNLTAFEIRDIYNLVFISKYLKYRDNDAFEM